MQDENLNVIERIQTAFRFKLSTENFLLVSPSLSDIKFLHEYCKISPVCKYMADSVIIDDENLIEFVNYFMRSEPGSNHIWLINKKSDKSLIGTFFFYNRDIDYDYTFVCCDIFKKEQMTFKQEKEAAEALCEVLSAAISHFCKEMNITNYFLPLYHESTTTVFFLEQLGFRKCSERNHHMQKYPHDLYMFTAKDMG